ncbi:LysR substrate-binding domain-containing protein [Paraburkholderia sp. USG1]|uniref:LysR family transcriptional regulator n=1 Tax=Paraburkholderia sp. USG1 TaxID=2952268 RepID=UPI0028552312|nr:LysR substrate-binding domain-containing protein [Paraburkholderia sp. USG1]MDR8398309.1 LysR substrate-binding domain-containing protein [Paraburkholderia sp. USG1]
MDKLECMRIFVRVAQAGGFARAASHTDLSTAAVSRAIMDLESRLETRLLHRTTRQVSITEAGQRYLEHCEQILAHVELAEAQATDAGRQPSGRLRIHANTSFGQHHLVPLIALYTQQFPDVSIDLVLAQRVPDLIEENYDVSIVVAPQLVDSSLISQCLGTAGVLLCASPRYLSGRGTPATVEELQQHTCLRLVLPDSSTGQWVFDGPDGGVFSPSRMTQFTVNVGEAMAEAIRAGMGIGVLPVTVALPGLRDGSLVQVLPALRLRPAHIHALYASRQYLDAKIRTFVGFLRESLPHRLAGQEQELRDWRNRQHSARTNGRVRRLHNVTG